MLLPGDMSPPVVAIEGARKVFGEHVAVDALDLVIPEGALYGFIVHARPAGAARR